MTFSTRSSINQLRAMGINKNSTEYRHRPPAPFQFYINTGSYGGGCYGRTYTTLSAWVGPCIQEERQQILLTCIMQSQLCTLLYMYLDLFRSFQVRYSIGVMFLNSSCNSKYIWIKNDVIRIEIQLLNK